MPKFDLETTSLLHYFTLFCFTSLSLHQNLAPREAYSRGAYWVRDPLPGGLIGGGGGLIEGGLNISNPSRVLKTKEFRLKTFDFHWNTTVFVQILHKIYINVNVWSPNYFITTLLHFILLYFISTSPELSPPGAYSRGGGLLSQRPSTRGLIGGGA